MYVAIGSEHRPYQKQPLTESVLVSGAKLSSSSLHVAIRQVTLTSRSSGGRCVRLDMCLLMTTENSRLLIAGWFL